MRITGICHGCARGQMPIGTEALSLASGSRRCARSPPSEPCVAPLGHQVKFGYVNFYPRKGTVFVDGEIRRRAETGLEALAAVLRELGYLR